MTDELLSVPLENGLLIRFFDQTNRYFGDFHRVCVAVKVEFPSDSKKSGDSLQEIPCYERSLERMGVTTAALDRERQALIDAFLTTSRPYLEKPGFPQQLLAKIQLKKKNPIFMRGSKF